jgi:hypothetical protein
MAREFPHAQVIGVDLAPVPLEPVTLPDNCRFEVSDINLGLDHFAGQIDLCHLRLGKLGNVTSYLIAKLSWRA